MALLCAVALTTRSATAQTTTTSPAESTTSTTTEGATTTTTGDPTPTSAPASTTTSSTEPASSTTSSTSADSPSSTSSTSTTVPVAPDSPDEAFEPVPTDPVVIPPRETPRPVTPFDVTLNRIVTNQVEGATRQLTVAQTADAQATSKAVLLGQRLATAEVRLNELQQNQRLAIMLVREKRDAVKVRAVSVYAGGGVNNLNSLLATHDFNQFHKRMSFINAVAARDRAAVDDWVTTRQAANADLSKKIEEIGSLRTQVSSAQAEAAAAAGVHLEFQTVVDSLRAGAVIAVNGFVFPVAAPHSFTDTFGAPRMPGTQYAHKHQGNDVFAAYGSPLVACERGVIVRVSVDLLGGVGLWIAGESGTRYYYAHLSAYAAELHNGQVVDAGDLVGFVGNSGNAATTPSHLHFEIHPNGGPAIDPYALLKAADDAAQAAANATTPPGVKP